MADERKAGRFKRRWSPITFCAVLSLAILAELLLFDYLGAWPNIKVRVSGHPPTCRSNLHMIGLGCQEYARDHDGRFPNSLDELYPGYVDNRRVFTCPLLRERKDARRYGFESGLRAEMPEDYVLAYDRAHRHPMAGRDGEGRNVVLLNGELEWWPAAREAEFQKRLAAQRAEAGETDAGKEGASP